MIKKLFDQILFEEHEKEWDFILKFILTDPCLQRFDHRKIFYLRTDFCAKGFRYVGLQSTNDRVSLEAMIREMEGGECEFMKTDNPTGSSLQAVCVGSCRCRGYEKRLHSYLGKTFSGDWAFKKVRHYIWGMRNTWITDGVAIRFLLTYDGDNGPILRIQMQIMMVFYNIVHRNACWILDADYMSRHGGNIWWDPLLVQYNQYASLLRKNHAAPMGPIKSHMMPGWRKPKFKIAAQVSTIKEYKGVVNTPVTVEDIPTKKDNKNTSDTLLSLMTSIEKEHIGCLHWLAIIPP